jgi:HPt (histidine-containing phosphotransfer) domain-containing protein
MNQNLAGTAHRIGISEATYRRLYSLFLESARVDLNELISSLSSGNRQSAASCAHQIFGAATNMDLHSIAQDAREIENLILDNHTDDLPALIALLSQRITAASTALEDPT